MYARPSLYAHPGTQLYAPAVRDNKSSELESSEGRKWSRDAPLPAHGGAERAPVRVEHFPGAAAADPRIHAAQMAAHSNTHVVVGRAKLKSSIKG